MWNYYRPRNVSECKSLLKVVRDFNPSKDSYVKVFFNATKPYCEVNEPRAPHYLVSLGDKSVVVQLSNNSDFKKFKDLIAARFDIEKIEDITVGYGEELIESFKNLSHSRHIQIMPSIIEENDHDFTKIFQLIKDLHLLNDFKSAEISEGIDLMQNHSGFDYTDRFIVCLMVNTGLRVPLLIEKCENYISKLQAEIDELDLSQGQINTENAPVFPVEELNKFVTFANRLIGDLQWLQIDPNIKDRKFEDIRNYIDITDIKDSENVDEVHYRFTTFKWLCTASNYRSTLTMALESSNNYYDPYLPTTVLHIIKKLNVIYTAIEKSEHCKSMDKDLTVSILRRLVYSSKSLEEGLSMMKKNRLNKAFKLQTSHV